MAAQGMRRSVSRRLRRNADKNDRALLKRQPSTTGTTVPGRVAHAKRNQLRRLVREKRCLRKGLMNGPTTRERAALPGPPDAVRRATEPRSSGCMRLRCGDPGCLGFLWFGTALSAMEASLPRMPQDDLLRLDPLSSSRGGRVCEQDAASESVGA